MRGVPRSSGPARQNARNPKNAGELLTGQVSGSDVLLVVGQSQVRLRVATGGGLRTVTGELVFAVAEDDLHAASEEGLLRNVGATILVLDLNEILRVVVTDERVEQRPVGRERSVVVHQPAESEPARGRRGTVRNRVRNDRGGVVEHERRLEEDVSLIIRHQRILNDSHAGDGADGGGGESRVAVALGGDELLVLLELGSEAGAHQCHVTGAGGAELLQVSLRVNEGVEDRIAVDLSLGLEVGGRVVGVADDLVRSTEDLLGDLVLVVVDESIGLTLENVAPRTVEVESLRLVGELHSGVVAVQLNLDL